MYFFARIINCTDHLLISAHQQTNEGLQILSSSNKLNFRINISFISNVMTQLPEPRLWQQALPALHQHRIHPLLVVQCKKWTPRPDSWQRYASVFITDVIIAAVLYQGCTEPIVGHAFPLPTAVIMQCQSRDDSLIFSPGLVTFPRSDF
jgi:hypothetical protein